MSQEDDANHTKEDVNYLLVLWLKLMPTIDILLKSLLV